MANQRITSNPMISVELISLFKHQLSACSLQPDELCLIITDTAFNPVVADACFGAAYDLGAEAIKLVIPYGKPIPKKSLRAAMLDADLIVYPTTHTLHYSDEMREFLAKGGRAMMAVQPLHALDRLRADQDVIRRAKRGAAYLQKADTIHFTSDYGTNLSMQCTGRPALATYGVADEPGHLDFWGGGMVQTAQLEGTLEGTLVLNTGDLIFMLARYIEHPVEIIFKEGRITEIKGNHLDAFMLRHYLHSFEDEHALMAGHMAWGVDRRADWLSQAIQYSEPGSSAADSESYYGNIQIEIGSNDDVAFTGKNRSMAHLGLCCLQSSLSLDGEKIIDHGSFVPQDLL